MLTMSNFQCDKCGMINIDCGWGNFKTPRELELEKKLNIALKALNKINKFNRILSIENDIVTAEYTEAAQIAQDALMQIEKWRCNE